MRHGSYDLVAFRRVVLMFGLMSSACTTRPPVTPTSPSDQALRPVVHPAVSPVVFEGSLERLPKSEPWKLGDPIREVEDLEGEGEIKPSPVAPGQVTHDLRDLPTTTPSVPGQSPREIDDLKRSTETSTSTESDSTETITTTNGTAPTSDSRAASGTVAATFQIGSSFEGIPATGWVPPDPVGDIGPKHYIQAVNISFAVYDRNGALLAGPSPINTLWSGFGGACEKENRGTEHRE